MLREEPERNARKIERRIQG